MGDRLRRNMKMLKFSMFVLDDPRAIGIEGMSPKNVIRVVQSRSSGAGGIRSGRSDVKEVIQKCGYALTVTAATGDWNVGLDSYALFL